MIYLVLYLENKFFVGIYFIPLFLMFFILMCWLIFFSFFLFFTDTFHEVKRRRDRKKEVTEIHTCLTLLAILLYFSWCVTAADEV